MYNNNHSEESDSFFCRFTFGQFFALLVIEVFTLFFVFYLGARYGREFLGFDKNSSADMAAVVEGETVAGETQVLTTGDPEAAKVAHELMAKAETPELKDRIAKMFNEAKNEEQQLQVAPLQEEVRPVPVVQTVDSLPDVKETQPAEAAPQQVAQAEPQVQQAQAEPTLEQVKAVAQRAEDNELKEVAKRLANEQAAKSKPAAGGKFSVQVGSYPMMKEAESALAKWKGKGYEAFIQSADLADRGRWFRVKIGGFETHEDAVRYLKEFKTRENIDALIVMNK